MTVCIHQKTKPLKWKSLKTAIIIIIITIIDSKHWYDHVPKSVESKVTIFWN